MDRERLLQEHSTQLLLISTELIYTGALDNVFGQPYLHFKFLPTGYVR